MSHLNRSFERQRIEGRKKCGFFRRPHFWVG